MSKQIFKFNKIDAFATIGSSGNPAGVIWLDSTDTITAEQMLQVAKELKGFVSEVCYIHKVSEDTFRLKYYSSEREVNFCGHATIAVMHELFSSDPNMMVKKTVNIITNDGTLIVENRLQNEGAVFIMSPVPSTDYRIPSLDKIAKALDISRTTISTELATSIVNAGLTTLLVPINSLENIIKISPELKDLNTFCKENDIDIVEVFTPEVSCKENDYRSRVFAATFGYLEDPATGSGNSALGYYLINNNLWNKETVVIEQNNSKDKYNIIKLQKREDSESRYRVIFGGGAIKRIDGEYTLYSQQ